VGAVYSVGILFVSSSDIALKLLLTRMSIPWRVVARFCFRRGDSSSLAEF